MAVTSTFPEIAAARMNLRRIPIDEQSGRVRGLRRRSPRLRRRRTTCGSAEVSRPPAPDSVAMTSRRNEPDANHHDEYGGSEQRASKHNLAHDHAHLTSGRGPLEARDERRRPDPAGPFATKVHDGKARFRSLTFRRDSDEVDTESRFNLNAAGVEPSRSHASPL